MNKNIYTDVMLDIETVGNKPGCGIISISAVLFNINTGKISNVYQFNQSINWKHQLLFGYNYDISTLNWWKGTNKKLFHKLSESENHFVEVAKSFQNWYRSIPNSSKLRLWANSPKFDICILEAWYRKALKGAEFKQFWNTWEERDVRTIASLDPNIKRNLKFIGDKHNSLDDCKHQIRYCHAIIKKYNLKIS